MKNLWKDWQQASCIPDCWCELARVGNWILEPVNTWTNLAFVFVGIFILFKMKPGTSENLINQNSFYNKLYGSALIFVGCGSFFFHMSQTLMGQWFDLMGMYFIIVFFIYYNFNRLGLITRTRFLALYIMTQVILGYAIYIAPQFRREIFGSLVIITLIQTIIVQSKLKTFIERKYLILSLVTYLLGQGIWLLDKNKIVCHPTAWMNGHGIWHITCSIAALFIFVYFSSEDKRKAI
jgi:hypothetical protein